MRLRQFSTVWSGLWVVFLVSLGVIGLSVSGTAYANISAWVEGRFEFEYEHEPIVVKGAQLFYCADAQCSAPRPWQEVEPSGEFRCTQDGCKVALYREGGGYLKMIVEFEDRTRESNVFEQLSRDARYRVRVTETGLQVTALERSFARRLWDDGFGLALPLTLIVEIAVASVYRVRVPFPRRYLGWVALASVPTLPVVWWIVLEYPDYVTGIVLAEVFAILFEAGFLYFAFRKRLTPARSLLLSVLMNGASFLVGIAVDVLILGHSL
jgi:hypothetical protein